MSQGSLLSGLIGLTRPVNAAISFLSIGMGAAVTGTLEPGVKVLLAALSGTLIGSAGNAINDYYDIDIDRINKPHRPIPSGRVSPRQAMALAIALFVAGVAMAFGVGPAAVLVASVATLLLVAYSCWLKRTALWGNLTVSAVTGAAFVYGGLAVGRVRAALIPAGFSFLFHLGREIVKDVEDLPGDRQARAKTLPILHGVRAAQWAVTVVFSLLIVATWLPYVFDLYNQLYLWIVILGVDTVLVYSLLVLWTDIRPKRLAFVSNLLKADMLVGLLAIYLGRQG
ncbi:MAG: geranylgeranylglycerol-phosphate geranylgeranyltransferase [candidate division KSB1 bacterium]|nr:geranylgeranylglycerol-phosphate geranylgeranyltransferase [candidate division KSB1 bacterium]